MYQGPSCFTLKSGVNAVAADGSSQIPGWVSGNIASLAASGSINVIFDLGPNWDSYTILQCAHSSVSGSSGITVGFVKSSTDGALTSDDLSLNSAYATGAGNLTAASSAGQRSFSVRPMYRFLIVNFTNADATNPVDANAFCLVTAYPRG